jgi:hypothetical protein
VKGAEPHGPTIGSSPNALGAVPKLKTLFNVKPEKVMPELGNVIPVSLPKSYVNENDAGASPKAGSVLKATVRKTAARTQIDLQSDMDRAQSAPLSVDWSSAEPPNGSPWAFLTAADVAMFLSR